jgi:hypothetical protein
MLLCKDWGCTTERLPSMNKALGSIPSTTKTIKQNKQKQSAALQIFSLKMNKCMKNC